MRRLAALALLVSVTGGLAACGQPSPTEVGSGGTTGPPGAEATPTAGGDPTTSLPNGGSTRRGGTSSTTSSTSSSTSSTSSTSSSSTSTTRKPNRPNNGTVRAAEFKQRAGELCNTFRSRGDALFKGSSTPTPAQFDQVIDLFKQFGADVKAIGTPEGLETESADFDAAWSELVTLFTSAKSAFTSEDKGALKPYEKKLDEVTEQIEAIGKKLGMDACFASASTSSTSGDDLDR